MRRFFLTSVFIAVPLVAAHAIQIINAAQTSSSNTVTATADAAGSRGDSISGDRTGAGSAADAERADSGAAGSDAGAAGGHAGLTMYSAYNPGAAGPKR